MNLDPYYDKEWCRKNKVTRETFRTQILTFLSVLALIFIVAIILLPIKEVKKERPVLIRNDTAQVRMEAEGWAKHYANKKIVKVEK